MSYTTLFRSLPVQNMRDQLGPEMDRKSGETEPVAAVPAFKVAPICSKAVRMGPAWRAAGLWSRTEVLTCMEKGTQPRNVGALPVKRSVMAPKRSATL